jgi:hypothetical protein
MEPSRYTSSRRDKRDSTVAKAVFSRPNCSARVPVSSCRHRATSASIIVPSSCGMEAAPTYAGGSGGWCGLGARWGGRYWGASLYKPGSDNLRGGPIGHANRTHDHHSLEDIGLQHLPDCEESGWLKLICSRCRNAGQPRPPAAARRIAGWRIRSRTQRRPRRRGQGP